MRYHIEVTVGVPDREENSEVIEKIVELLDLHEDSINGNCYVPPKPRIIDGHPTEVLYMMTEDPFIHGKRCGLLAPHEWPFRVFRTDE